MADPKQVKKYLDEIERKRKVGVAVETPGFARNILGGKSEAFTEAVKQQGKTIKPRPFRADASWDASQGKQRDKEVIPKSAPTAPNWSDAEKEHERLEKIKSLRVVK